MISKEAQKQAMVAVASKEALGFTLPNLAQSRNLLSRYPLNQGLLNQDLLHQDLLHQELLDRDPLSQ